VSASPPAQAPLAAEQSLPGAADERAERQRRSNPPRGKTSRWADAVLICLLAAVAATVCLTGNWGSEFWWNDAARHAMDGVFMLDLVRDLPASLGLVEYGATYYARYPCLGVIHYPPVFPAVESLLFAILGVSMAVARITVGAFAALGAATGYLMARRFVGRLGGAVFVLLLFTAPGVVYWSRDVMLETPMLAVMLAASYAFTMYVEDGKRGAGVAAAVLLALAALTKQNAACLAPVWLCYALWRRRTEILRRRETWVGAGVAVVLLTPFVMATVHFAPLNVSQSVGNSGGEFTDPRLSWASVRFYVRYFPRYASTATVLGILTLCVALVGHAVRNGWRGDVPAWLRGAVFALLWVGWSYLLFTFVIAIKEWRHILAWSPGLALLGAIGVSRLATGGRWGRLAAGVLTAGAAVQAALCVAGERHDLAWLPAPYVSGTEAPAKWLARAPDGTVAFYAGNFNGNFIFNLRRFDPGHRAVMLRASKMLFTMPAMQEHGLTVHAKTQAEILKVLRDNAVRFVLVENQTPTLDRVGPSLPELRRLVRSDAFTHVAAYPISSTVPALSRRLDVFELREHGPARKRMLKINVPLGGRSIEVPFPRLGVPVEIPKRTKPRPNADRN
jgi:4-amino-4-deoxy-L-arabinose transferase-like glycosyltransferase